MKLGKISNTILERSVFKLIRRRGDHNIPKPRLGQDAVRIDDVSGAVLVSTQAGRWQVYRAVNNIYAAGGRPIGLTACITMDTRSREIRLKEIVRELERQACLVGIPITGGHTMVSADVNKPVVCITAVGSTGCKRGVIKPGQDIVMTGWIGISGVRQIIENKQEELRQHFPLELIDKALGNEEDMLVENAVKCLTDYDVYMHDVSEGGVFAELWNLAEYGGVGLNVELKKIPVKQEIIEICELFNINPYELESLGCLLMTSDNGCDIVRVLNSNGIRAEVIGKVTDGNDRIISTVDEERFLELPKQDEVYKFI